MLNALIHGKATPQKRPIYAEKLFVVDGDLGEVKIYDTDSYKPAGSIKVREGADSSAYDPSTKSLYVVDVGKDAKLPNSYITIIDMDAAKVAGESGSRQRPRRSGQSRHHAVAATEWCVAVSRAVGPQPTRRR